MGKQKLNPLWIIGAILLVLYIANNGNTFLGAVTVYGHTCDTYTSCTRDTTALAQSCSQTYCDTYKSQGYSCSTYYGTTTSTGRITYLACATGKTTESGTVETSTTSTTTTTAINPVIEEYNDPSISADNTKNTITGTFYLQNTGASMNSDYYLEMQIRPQGVGVLSVALEQKQCDPKHPENVGKYYRLNTGEKAIVKLTSSNVGIGTWDIWGVSVKGCYPNNEVTGPYGSSYAKISSVTFTSNNCDSTICTNGEFACNTFNRYSEQCVQWDSDPCFEYKPIEQCANGCDTSTGKCAGTSPLPPPDDNQPQWLKECNEDSEVYILNDKTNIKDEPDKSKSIPVDTTLYFNQLGKKYTVESRLLFRGTNNLQASYFSIPIKSDACSKDEESPDFRNKIYTSASATGQPYSQEFSFLFPPHDAGVYDVYGIVISGECPATPIEDSEDPRILCYEGLGTINIGEEATPENQCQDDKGNAYECCGKSKGMSCKPVGAGVEHLLSIDNSGPSDECATGWCRETSDIVSLKGVCAAIGTMKNGRIESGWEAHPTCISEKQDAFAWLNQDLGWSDSFKVTPLILGFGLLGLLILVNLIPKRST